MSQPAYITLSILAAFLLFLASRNRLGVYLGAMGI